MAEEFRRDYVAHAARVLSFIKKGNIHGVAYNFDDLIKNLGTAFSNQKGYRLNPEVYTRLLGNCTAERLESLFKSLLLPPPFSDLLGLTNIIKTHFAETAKGRASSRAKEKLDEQISLRNDIVHGDLTRVIDLGTLNDTLNFFRALITAFDQIIRDAQK